MSTKASPSATALAQAEALVVKLKPFLVEMIERNDPAVKNLTFNDIESNAAATGDLLAKLIMQQALAQQTTVTASEEIAARQAVLQKASKKNSIQKTCK